METKYEDKLYDKRIGNAVITFIVASLGITLFFLWRLWANNYRFWSGTIEFDKTGQVGDFIGGVVGTIISAAGFYFLYLTLREQRKAIQQQENAIHQQENAIKEQRSSFEKERFESKFIDLVKLHRDNVADIRCQVLENGQVVDVYSREAIKAIFNEYIECLHEVKKFARVYKGIEILQAPFSETLDGIKTQNGCKATVNELALIDIAYCIVFFGISEESDQVFLNLFWNRYNKEFIKRLKKYLRLKPTSVNGNTVAFSNWLAFSRADSNAVKEIFEPFYLTDDSLDQWLNIQNGLFANYHAECYYKGHQHQLGHYFRHLFQTFKFLSIQTSLSSDDKYFFAKTLRAQLSTYEQLLLFINSLSSLGMKWEYTADIPKGNTNCYDPDDFRFLTRYNLIKNLPGSQYYEFQYKRFYPNVRFEYKDDISYQ
jgi:hypothetical protein